MIGQRLGNWVIDAELGRGGMAHVYHAHEVTPTGPGRTAAVKVLPAPLAQDPSFLSRFQREIEILRQLDHPHIVRLYDAGTDDDRCFYAMEYVSGPNVEQELQRKGRWSWPDVLGVAMQVSLALKHAHDRGIIHRDIKPANLLIQSATADVPGSTLVKLTDFGIARVFAGTHLTAVGGVVGTPEYLSPEQAIGKTCTSRSDLYSLGVVLYQLLAGRCPFEGETVVDLLHKHRYAQPENPSRLVPGLPHDLEAIVLQLLDKDPSKRPADGLVLYKQLDRLRKKYERQGKLTMPGLPPPPADGPLIDDGTSDEQEEQGPGPATLMSQLLREELEREKKGGPINRVLNRWWVLVPLLVVCLGLIVWSVWPLGPETLYERGAALMQSEDSADWERGWTEYLSRLERDFPDHPHREDLHRFRRQYEDYVAQRDAERAVREAERTARKTGTGGGVGEAQWFYENGLRLRQQGDEVGAARVWRGLVTAFRDVPSENPWVVLAERELARPNPGSASGEVRWAAVRQALDRARRLAADGKAEEAAAICQALTELYRDDPSARGIVEEARQIRGLGRE
jgi:serine/threonine-protein kinase